jgi:hypothetical protein
VSGPGLSQEFQWYREALQGLRHGLSPCSRQRWGQCLGGLHGCREVCLAARTFHLYKGVGADKLMVSQDCMGQILRLKRFWPRPPSEKLVNPEQFGRAGLR